MQLYLVNETSPRIAVRGLEVVFALPLLGDFLLQSGLFGDGGWLSGGLRPVPERLGQQEKCSAHQAAVGKIEDRPIERAIVKVHEVADAAEGQPVVKVAHRASQDQAQ